MSRIDPNIRFNTQTIPGYGQERPAQAPQYNDRQPAADRSQNTSENSSNFADLLNSAHSFNRLEQGQNYRGQSGQQGDSKNGRKESQNRKTATGNSTQTATSQSDAYARAQQAAHGSEIFSGHTTKDPQAKTFSDQIRFSKKIDDAEVVSEPALSSEQFAAAESGSATEIEDISEITQPGFLMSKLSQLGYTQPIALRA